MGGFLENECATKVRQIYSLALRLYGRDEDLSRLEHALLTGQAANGDPELLPKRIDYEG